MKYDLKHIRNFSIIAHIDHGKSTLADRILESTGAVEVRELKEQLLDDLELERRRGITIKLNAVSINYHAKNGEDYLFNLIDTPGHVDFTYEVSRSLAACEGAILVIDATQGVEAQTIANAYLAIDNDLTILPIINKMDLPSADLDRTKEELIDALGMDPSEAVPVSAKTGLNIDKVLEKIVEDLPCPQGDINAPLKALIFDSHFDPYRGVIMMIRVKEGTIHVGDTILLMSTKKEYLVTELGIRTPKEVRVKELGAGEVGYLSAQIKDIHDVMVGDTVTLKNNSCTEALPGYRKLNPMVYSGIYPADNDDFEALREALEKLALNDAALVYEPETSTALGSGFRCGFLGLLHLEVVQERLENEYGLDLISTSPSVIYHVTTTDNVEHIIDNPCEFPPTGNIKGVLADMISCIKELILDGKNVKLDDLAIFSVGIVSKKGATSAAEFSLADNVKGLKLRARATGELSNAQINLEGQLKETSQYNVDDSSSSGGTPPDNGEEENPLG